jgi:hypothetical protein
MAPKAAKAAPKRAPPAATPHEAAASCSSSPQASAGVGILEQVNDRHKRGRKLRRRSSSDKVSRALDLHFPGTSVCQRESKRIAGRTVREQVKIDMDAAGGRLGASYWQATVAQFAFSDSVLGDLKVADGPKQPVGDDLTHAIGLAMDTNSQARSGQQLCGLLQHRASLNQREFVGLLVAIQRFAAAGLAKNTVDTSTSRS